jgi:beta-mannosidase
VRLLRRRCAAVESWTRRATLDGPDGVLEMQLRVRPLDEQTRPVGGQLHVGDESAPMEWQPDRGQTELSTRRKERALGQSRLSPEWNARAAVRIPNAAPWWPHTHGTPALYPVHVEIQFQDGSTALLEDEPVGFRAIDGGPDPAGDAGLALSVNGESVFCRGVVWTPLDAVSLSAPEAAVRERLTLLRDAGFNMIRIAGTMVYEDDAFHRICDELGLLVWQDMMFANMDYPYGDAGFRDAVQSEAETELARLARHPSTAVICGNSEIEQQAAMLGLDSSIARGAWFGEDLPRIAERRCPGIPYLPSAPCGGDLPFRTSSGVANYFGVGAYLRPLEDARRAEVRFASECLAFANVPEPEMVERMAAAAPGGASPIHPAWKRGVTRDTGAGWDFEDVRDHYLKLLYSVEPAALRYADQTRYLELSRMASGEVMAEVFGEWRRAASPCGGGIVLWSADLEPGAGWGILDSGGRPKAAYWFLKRALAPCAVWMTDEGLNGIDIHIANDGAEAIEARLRVAVYRRGEQRVAEAERAVTVPAHGALRLGVEQILGRFMDAAYAFRFGPPGHNLVAASLFAHSGEAPFSQAFRFPTGPSVERIPIHEAGITGRAIALPDGRIEVTLNSRRFAWGVRIEAPGFLTDDAYFGIEPGCSRRVTLSPTAPASAPARIWVTAANAEERLPLAIERPL